MSEKPEPSAEDWIIFRLLNAWGRDVGGLGFNPIARRTVAFMVKKLGKDTVLDMAKQLEEENKQWTKR